MRSITCIIILSNLLQASGIAEGAKGAVNRAGQAVGDTVSVIAETQNNIANAHW